MNPSEQWERPFTQYAPDPRLSALRQRDLGDIAEQFEFLLRRLLDKLPSGHARTEALTHQHASFLWARMAIEHYGAKEE